ncbi:MAG: hypothetical protein IJW51_07810 [Clostridia bacterium]|nr:hypothetical protein [Clostridia bacterium]
MKTAYLTLADLFAVFKKRFVSILLVTLLCFAAGFGLGTLLPPRYGATATFYVRNMQSEALLESYGLTSSQLAVVQTMAKEYAEVAQGSDAFLERVIERHDLPQTKEALRGMITTATESTRFTVTVTSKNPAVVDAVIKAIEAELPDFIQEIAWPNLSVDFTVVTLFRAAAPAARTTPHPAVFGGVLAAAGLLLTYLLHLLRFLFANRLADVDEISRALPSVPVIGIIPEIKPPLDGTEVFYALRERLPRAAGGACTVAVTSPTVGEGKSYVASELAHSLAVAGKNVLLIDADLRRGGKDAFFRPDRYPGLSEYLSGKELRPEALVSTTGQSGLSILPAGPIPVPPCDYPISERIAALLQAFEKQYDYILVDFPAVTLAAEAIACTADFAATLLVVAPRKCGARELRTSAKLLGEAGGNLVGLVANIAPKNI